MGDQLLTDKGETGRHLLETLQRLRADYTATLGSKIDEVEAAAAQLSGAPCLGKVGKALTDIRSHAHKLAGSGATFGYAAMGETARNLEHAADRVLEEGEGLSERSRDELLGLMSALRAAAERGSDGALELPFPATDDEVASHSILGVDEGRSVLLVEDDVELSAQLGLELENFGFSVTTLGNPTDLQAALEKTDCAAVVMDVVFEGDDKIGTETIRQLKHDGALPQPVIFLSGITDAETRIAAVRAGCDAFLTKPVSVTELVDTLDRLTGPDDTEPFRVLIIDDDLNMARYSEAVLKGAGMITMAVTEPLEALEAIESFSPELILLDLYMQTCSGTEIALMIRQNRALAGLPIVFLSSESETTSQLDAMRRGGDDFLLKSMKPDHLATAVVLRATRFRALRALMVRDSLTGLLDHSTTKQALETEIARSQRNDEPLTFALIDIDHFKSVNDRYGHQVGDWVIKSLARLLKQRLRGVDIIGRMGGEEFAAVLAGADSAAAHEIFDRIRIVFSEIVHRSEDKMFQVTFSCGIAGYPCFGDASSLTEAADKALYQAKRAGRDQVVVALRPEKEPPIREAG